MAPNDFPKLLDTPEMRKTVLSVLSLGGSRRTAARIVGCYVSTITRTAATDPTFLAEMQKAEKNAEIEALRNIHRANQEPRYWRASAWMLERLNPEDFAVHPEAPSGDYFQSIINGIAYAVETLIEDIPDKYTAEVRQRMEEMVNGLDHRLASVRDFLKRPPRRRPPPDLDTDPPPIRRNGNDDDDEPSPVPPSAKASATANPSTGTAGARHPQDELKEVASAQPDATQSAATAYQFFGSSNSDASDVERRRALHSIEDQESTPPTHEKLGDWYIEPLE